MSIRQLHNRILLVDDENGIRFALGTLLRKEGYLVDAAADICEARGFLRANPYDLIYIDITLGKENGIDLLREIRKTFPASQVVMFTGNPRVESAAEAVRLGAFDYICKPIRIETLIAVTKHALSSKALADERERNRANLDAIFRTGSDGIVMIDQNGCLAQFNTTSERVCGYHSDLIGSDAATINLGCFGVCRKALAESLHSKTTRELRRVECCPSSGKSRVISITATPVTELNGVVSGAVAIIRDETQMVEMERSLQKRGRFHGIVGASEVMQRVYSLIGSLADMPTTVLINGESGTGKELVAGALHFSGTRSRGPFVKVNCSALSEHLLESELFGHVRGAFTGAISDKIGRFQKAHGGTLFLDEIGDISPAIQMRLLRVLQESEFERVGDATPIKVDVRIVAATNKNLADMVATGMFRSDLYYRLNVVRMVIPPLRERLDDLDLLVANFITLYNNKLSKNITAVSDDVMELFHSYQWPGNVRELEHAIEHASILSKASIISLQDLPQDLSESARSATTYQKHFALPTLADTAKMTIGDALAAADGNKARAARLLGISRMTLYRQLESQNN
ncbi:MAG: sigma-54-dependent Fis family transcriptional regulator [Desulfuromonadaceae bacterium]|nr:sigma-54-dependent Fis family transcriptional regulator [Desulfuromonadaceae bacterium]MDD5105263.1 sigma-54-dependent Fis family transcriptional regulator [Desulfuromonadaceae bacterium]